MSINTPAKPITLKDYKSDLHNDWCPGCVTSDTLIILGDGKRKEIRDIVVGELVLGHDGKPHRVAEVMSHWHPDSIQRLVVRFLGAVVLTSDHPVYRAVSTGAGDYAYEWTPAGDIRPGDLIATPATALARSREPVQASAEVARLE